MVTADAAPRLKRFTFDEFLRLGELDMLTSRAELWDGEILEMPPIGLPHTVCHFDLHTLLGDHWRRPRMILSQSTFRFASGWAPEPDLALLDRVPKRDDADYGVPRLVIEIMQSSDARDLVEKKLRYAQHEVPEYWVADLPRRVMHVFRQPVPDAEHPEAAWQDVAIVKPGGSVSPLCLPELTIVVDEVLP